MGLLEVQQENDRLRLEVQEQKLQMKTLQDMIRGLSDQLTSLNARLAGPEQASASGLVKA